MPKRTSNRRADRYDTLRSLLRGAIAEHGGTSQIADLLNISYNTLTRRIVNPSELRLSEIIGLAKACKIDKDMLGIVLNKLIEGV